MEKKFHLTSSTLILFLSMFFMACHKKGDPSPSPPPQNTVDIYIAGNNSLGFSRTSYSKNFGSAVVIKDAAQNFDGNSIVVSGSDVYVSGFGISTTGSVFSPTYYKNESPVLINDGSRSAFATSISLYESDVYVAGWTENVAGANSHTACYWKNGTITLLGDGKSQSLARKIAVVRKS